MKTTLELPDELMREVKIRAVHEHKKLKDTVAELIRKGIAADKSRNGETAQTGQTAPRLYPHNGGHRGGNRLGQRVARSRSNAPRWYQHRS